MAYCMHPRLRALSILIINVASMLVAAGLAEEPPSPYRIDLIHVDANGGFTRDELIRRAAHRTHLRAATLSATASHHTAGVGLSQDGYEYLVDLEIGTWPEAKPFRAVLDTGSSIVLVTKLKLCDPNSSSFTRVSCTNGNGAQAEPLSCWNGLSMFDNTYGSNMITKGFMGSETLTLISATTRDIIRVDVGCAFDIGCVEDVLDCSNMIPKEAAGILGLNRGPYSLLNQFEPNLRKFSYCLNDQSKPDLKSQLLLGHVPDLTATGSQVQTTKLITGENSDDKYYVGLVEISIDGHGLLKEFTKESPATMMVDSGSSYTSLPAEDNVLEELKNYVANLFPVEPFKSGNLFCFDGEPEKPPESRPEMTLTFSDEATMHLPWNQYMAQYDEGWCIAVEENNHDKFILGNFQQQNKIMLYDLVKEQLSFVPADCTQQPRDMHTCIHVDSMHVVAYAR